jgi:hypothetical protein
MTTVVRCLAGAAFAAALLIGGGTLAANWLSPASAANEQAAKAEVSPENKCVADTAQFKAEDKHAYFIVALENTCEQRVKCEVNANIKTARGKRHGHATLVLGPRSAGAEAKKSYSLRVKVAGGMAQVERDCTAF